MDYGYVIERNTNDYLIFVNKETHTGSYNVVPKDIDPYNAYDIEDVKKYVSENPDKLITKEQYETKLQELEQKRKDKEELAKQEAELAELNKQLFNEMVNIVFASSVSVMSETEEGTAKTSIQDILARRAELLKSIEELKKKISGEN